MAKKSPRKRKAAIKQPTKNESVKLEQMIDAVEIQKQARERAYYDSMIIAKLHEAAILSISSGNDEDIFLKLASMAHIAAHQSYGHLAKEYINKAFEQHSDRIGDSKK